MPVKVKRKDGKFRVVEHDGKIAKRGGSAVDGGGHGSKEKAAAQARAINKSMGEKARRRKK
jgi:hypothetical protein